MHSNMQFLRRFRRFRKHEEISTSSKLAKGQMDTASQRSMEEKTGSKSKTSISVNPSSLISATASEILMLRTRGYQLYEKIGEGAYSKIFRATFFDAKIDNRGPTALACKVIDETYASDDFVDKFFQRSAEIMSLLNHAHLVKLHSIMTRRRKYFVFMEYAPHGDLLEFIEKNGPIKELQCRVWFSQILSGIHCLHDADIAHRDLKCENILLDRNYRIKIADFDFARWTVDDHGRPIQSNTFCGSPSYAAPEVINGTAYDPKIADIWSLGVVLFIMLNKSMPFDDHNLKDLYDAQVNRKWFIRNSLKDVISEDAESLIRMILEPDPNSRPNLNAIIADKWLHQAKKHGSRGSSRSRHSSSGSGHRTPHYKISRSQASVNFPASSLSKVLTEDTILALSSGAAESSQDHSLTVPGSTAVSTSTDATTLQVPNIVITQVLSPNEKESKNVEKDLDKPNKDT